MVIWSSIAILAIAVPGWILYRRFGIDPIAERNQHRRATSRVVGRSEPVDAQAVPAR